MYFKCVLQEITMTSLTSSNRLKTLDLPLMVAELFYSELNAETMKNVAHYNVWWSSPLKCHTPNRIIPIISLGNIYCDSTIIQGP